MIIRGEHMQIDRRHPQGQLEVEPVQPAQPHSVYTDSGDFLVKADELLAGYDAASHDFVVCYETLRDARQAIGREFNNTDVALAEGSVSYQQVVTNAMHVWPVKNLGQPSWPNAPY